MAAFYALFGLVRLVIWLDLGLLVAPIALLVGARARGPAEQARFGTGRICDARA